MRECASRETFIRVSGLVCDAPSNRDVAYSRTVIEFGDMGTTLCQTWLAIASIDYIYDWALLCGPQRDDKNNIIKPDDSLIMVGGGAPAIGR